MQGYYKIDGAQSFFLSVKLCRTPTVNPVAVRAVMIHLVRAVLTRSEPRLTFDFFFLTAWIETYSSAVTSISGLIERNLLAVSLTQQPMLALF